jgi:hypothetical protein
MIALKEVLSWLNVHDRTHLSDDSAAFCSLLETALEGQKFDQAGDQLRRLQQVVHRSRDDSELVEIGIVSGRALDTMGKHDQAEAAIRDAILRAWPDRHRRAVAECMLGCVLWKSPARHEETLLAWRNGLDDLNELSVSRARSPEEKLWYLEKAELVHRSILEAIQNPENFPTPAAVRASPEKPVRRPARPQSKVGAPKEAPPSPVPAWIGSPGPAETPIPVRGDLLRLFTVLEEIPAGGFGATGSDPHPLAQVEIDQVLIDGKPYRIHNLRGRRIVNLPSDSKLFVLKVKGDSMDRENILDSDYVLLRQVDEPSSGDFVAAEILGVDSQATLKRFVVEKDQAILQPRSNNPAHQPFAFKKNERGFFVRGVVLAILKPA